MAWLYPIFHWICICAASFTFLRIKKFDKLESCGHSIWLSMAFLCCTYKILFILSISEFSVYIDLLIDAACIVLSLRNRLHLQGLFIASFNFFQYNRTISKYCYTALLLYLFFLALILQPVNIDTNSYHESRILLSQQNNTLTLNQINDPCEVIYGLGYDIILHNHLRFFSDRGIAIYGFCAFLSILSFIYLISKMTLRKSESFLPVLFFLGMIEPVYQSLSANNDLPGTCASLACLYCFLKFRSDTSIIRIVLCLISLSWVIACKTTYVAFVIPLALLFIRFMYINKNKCKHLFVNMIHQPATLIAICIFILIISPIIEFTNNFRYWGHWAGSQEIINHATNQNGISGAIGNSFRYLFESIHAPYFIEHFAYRNFGFSIVDKINCVWSNIFFPIFGTDGESTWPFSVNWEQLEDSWYGPIGCACLVATFVSPFFKTMDKFRLLGFIAIIYFGILSYKLSWRPFNDRYFTLFFAIGSIILSGWIRMDKFRRPTAIILKCTLFFFFAWAVLFNVNAATFNFLSINPLAMARDSFGDGHNIIARSDWGKKKIGCPELDELTLKLIPTGSRVGIFQESYYPNAPLLISLRNHEIVPLRYELIESQFIKHENCSFELLTKQGITHLFYIGSNTSSNSFNQNKFLVPIWKHSSPYDNSLEIVLYLFHSS
jgi:hypothetical protein